MFLFFTDGKQYESREGDMITLDMITCDRVLDMIIAGKICNNDVTGADFQNSLYAFGESEKN